MQAGVHSWVSPNREDWSYEGSPTRWCGGAVCHGNGTMKQNTRDRERRRAHTHSREPNHGNKTPVVA